MKHIDIFTDGACTGNPGPGGWGCILKYGSVAKEMSGGAKETTNNRMELSGVISALYALKEPCEVTIFTDSKYVSDAINQGWLEKWQKNGWVKSNKTEVLNVDLWKILIELLKVHEVRFQWIKGHNGHPENERCDELARGAIASII